MSSPRSAHAGWRARFPFVTFPGTGKTPAISHVLTLSDSGQDGQEESSSTEVRRVIALVLEHASTRPRETLGVITMGIRHADRIQAALDETLLNPFEADVYATLTDRGMRLLPQWGASKYRIDMVALHPNKAGRFVLAIECDGATYHAAPTARDRDRLRQQHLEGLGWRFHRIWSTDWFTRREQEINRVFTAYQAAVTLVNQEDASAVTKSTKAKETNRSPAPLPTESLPLAPQSAKGRGPRPNVPVYGNIQDYADSDLLKLLSWLRSDSLLRTDEELIAELVGELGFKRRGTRIDACLRRILELDRVGRHR